MYPEKGDRVILTRDFYPSAWGGKIYKGTKGVCTEYNHSILGNTWNFRFDGVRDTVEMNQTAVGEAVQKI